MKPYFQSEGVTLYHGDCREIIPTLPRVDLLLTDPPYGINLNTDNSRFSGGTKGHVAKGRRAFANVRPIANDDKDFDPAFLVEFGKHQIIWGWNHFPNKLPRGATLVWLKKYDEAFGTFLSDAETAWMSKGHGVYCRRDLSLLAIANERDHPTQKPVSLMEWCLSFFPNSESVFDPFAGSGTTGVACVRLGRQFIGCEIEEKYCEIAARRIKKELAQGKLFEPESVTQPARQLEFAA